MSAALQMTEQALAVRQLACCLGSAWTKSQSPLPSELAAKQILDALDLLRTAKHAPDAPGLARPRATRRVLSSFSHATAGFAHPNCITIANIRHSLIHRWATS